MEFKIISYIYMHIGRRNRYIKYVHDLEHRMTTRDDFEHVEHDIVDPPGQEVCAFSSMPVKDVE